MVKVEFLEMWAKPFHKKSTHVASVQKASVFDHHYDEWEGGICVVLQHNLFGGEANWGLISGWETAKLEIKKYSSEGEQLGKKKEDYEVMNIDPGRWQSNEYLNGGKVRTTLRVGTIVSLVKKNNWIPSGRAKIE